MIEIKSYLRAADGQFVEVGAVNHAPPNARYIEGALELIIDGVRVLDTEMWDYVDQLWAYICDMVRTLQEVGRAATYFPDQPIRLSFRKQGKSHVLIVLEMNDLARKVLVEETALISALRAHGLEFFAKMTELFPENRDSYADAVARLNQN